MAGNRFLVLGLASARSSWFRSLGSWANSGAIPVELVKCLSAAEVRARLGSGRRYSALVADASLPSFDRDLVAAANHCGCAVIVIDDGRARRDWKSLGAARVLDDRFERDDLVAALSAHAQMIQRHDDPASELLAPARVTGWRAPVVALTGPGGTGVSTAAIALAQSLADDVRHSGLVCLADLRLHAEQAMLHDARDLVPSVQELVEAHRSGQPSAESVRAATFSVVERRYHLLLGLGRARFWAAIRPQAFAAAFESLRRAFRILVCDIDADLEGEDAGGSIDVEERHVMSRTAALQADVVLVVGLPTMKGLHSLVRVVSEVLSLGVPESRILPVINRAPSSPRARARLTSTVAGLLDASVSTGIGGPVFLPDRPVEKQLRDGTCLPGAIGAPLAGAVAAVLNSSAKNGSSPANGSYPQSEPAFEKVKPGSLGRWADEGAR